MRLCKLFCSIIIISVLSCSNRIKTEKLFSNLNSNETGISFINKINDTEELNIFKYRNFYNGGGVAIGDINNDGLPDIYFSANQNQNKLYLNKGDFKFEDITQTANVGGKNVWSTGVVMVDINNDSYLDIYVCNAGNVKGDDLKNELFINNGDLTFTEKAQEYNLTESGLTTHAAFFDYDLDGDLDAYTLNNSFIPVSSLNYSNKRELRDNDWDVPELLKGGGDKLLRNDNGKFTDVSEEAGIFGSLIGFGMGVTVGDINEDGYPDIYVSNDFYEKDYLYINNKNGSFSESIEDWTNHISQSSMGADMADINNDGSLDIFVTDMLPEKSKRLKETTQFENFDLYQRKQGLDFYHQYLQNTLQLNTGNNHLSEIAHFSGLSKTDWSWGALIFDMDNDGFKDIFVCNGIYHDLTNQDFVNFFANDIIQNMVVSGVKEDVENIIDKMPSTPITNYAFKNNTDLTFSNETLSWGFETPSFSNGAAYADLDNDGDLDLVINNVNQEAFIYKNNTSSINDNKYIKIKLKGDSLNTMGVGSVIKLFTGNNIITQEVIPSRGFQSSTDYVQTIGIGSKQIDSIRISWPNLHNQTITGIEPNKLYVFNQVDATSKKDLYNKEQPTFFSEVENPFQKHIENNHVDFDYEGLIQHMLSKEGPTIQVADFNKDGLDDIFIGGAKQQAAKIYLQNNQNSFIDKNLEVFEQDKNQEDTASAAFDVDNDGDIDLMVGSGGNELYEEKYYKTRIYLNNGKGNFTKSRGLITTTFHNTAVIAPCDFDSDGDIDVFIGSRSVPAVYGVNPKHLLLENDGKGNFKDVTQSKAFAFKELGMVTDAQWEDFDNDNKKDLIISRDWDAPIIFKNNGRRLSVKKSTLDNLKGWWRTVTVKDINNDNKPDLILGNKGLNLPYIPTEENSVKLFINDFDNNGTIEQIATQQINGKDIPIIMKHELTNQIVSLKKQNMKFSEYAAKSIQELFPADVFEESMIKEVNNSKSLVALNQGNSEFKIIDLPNQVQFSSVNAIEVLDINNDKHLDLVLGGNEYNYKPQYSRLDANFGSVLVGDGTGTFNWLNYDESGIFVKGEIKNINQFKSKKHKYLILGINNKQPKLFKLNNE